MSAAPRPGWYPDPSGADDRFRWWDGIRWSDDTTDTPQAPAPELVGPTLSEPARHRSPALLVVTVLVCGALVLSAGAGISLLVRPGAGGTDPVGASRSTEASEPVAPGSAATGPRGELDETTRRASIGDASMLLPSEPYQVHSAPLRVEDLLDVAFVAEAYVHRRTSGARTWSAMVTLSCLSSELSAHRELDAQAAELLEQFTRRMYGPAKARLGKLATTEHVVDGRPGIRVQTVVRYRIKDLPSRYDTVTAVLVQLRDGTVVAALSSVPNDAGAELTDLAEGSLASLTITG